MLLTMVAILAAATHAIDFKRDIEIMLPMRDGVELHTVVHLPRQHIAKKKSGKYPTVMDRSPYGYSDMEWVPDLFLPFDFVAVGQDMRGTEKSGGNFTMWHGDADDSRDLGDWIVQQEWSDGRVFTLGASADGIESYQTPKTHPEWLAGQYVIWAPAKLYEVLFPGGTYKQKTTEDWLHGLDPKTPWIETCIQQAHENEAQTDFWKQIELSDTDYNAVGWPSGFYAGWYDLFLGGTLEAWNGYNFKSLPEVRGKSKLIVDPCGHCLEAGQYFKPNTVDGRTALVLAQAFETFGIYEPLREKAGIVKQVTFYVMSSTDDAGTAAGQYWTSLDAWPEYTPTKFFLHGDGSASTDSAASGTDSTVYKHDPENPIPTLGGNNLPASIGGSIPCGPLDQSPIDSRDDLVLFNVPVQEEELVLTGEIAANLFVSSDMIDTDFMVRVSDVYNDDAGTVRLLQDNAVRMRWRNAGLTPDDIVPGQVYEIQIPLANTSYVVAPGHQLRFSVQSSNFPRFSVNNGNGILLADPAYPGPANVAQNTIYHSEKYPSSIILPVIADKEKSLPSINLMDAVQKRYPHITNELIKKAGKWIHKEMAKVKKH